MLVRHVATAPRPRLALQGMDAMFEQIVNSMLVPRAYAPTVDGTWADDSYVMTVDLPGVPADAVTVEVTGSTLSIDVHATGFEWSRRVRLGAALDPDSVTAHHVDGRLTIRVAALPASAARRIEISTELPAVPAADGDPDATRGDTIETPSGS